MKLLVWGFSSKVLVFILVFTFQGQTTETQLQFELQCTNENFLFLLFYTIKLPLHTSDPTIPVHKQQNQNNWIKEAESCVEVQFPGEFSTTSDTWFNVHVKTITSRNFKPNVVTKSQPNYYLVNRKSNSDKEQKSHAFLNSVMTNDTAWNIFNNNTKSYSVATLMIHVLNFIS